MMPITMPNRSQRSHRWYARSDWQHSRWNSADVIMLNCAAVRRASPRRQARLHAEEVERHEQPVDAGDVSLGVGKDLQVEPRQHGPAPQEPEQVRPHVHKLVRQHKSAAMVVSAGYMHDNVMNINLMFAHGSRIPLDAAGKVQVRPVAPVDVRVAPQEVRRLREQFSENAISSTNRANRAARRGMLVSRGRCARSHPRPQAQALPENARINVKVRLLLAISAVLSTDLVVLQQRDVIAHRQKRGNSLDMLLLLCALLALPGAPPREVFTEMAVRLYLNFCAWRGALAMRSRCVRTQPNSQ